MRDAAEEAVAPRTCGREREDADGRPSPSSGREALARLVISHSLEPTGDRLAASQSVSANRRTGVSILGPVGPLIVAAKRGPLAPDHTAW